MSYIPAGNNVNHWQSQFPSTGPVRSMNAPQVHSGSKRNYGPVNTGRPFTGKVGGILQGTLGQYGNYLLYRDAVRYQEEHVKAQQAAMQDKALNQGVGNAANSLLGGPTSQSPGKKPRGGGGGQGPNPLGPPRPGGPVGPKDPFGRVATDQFGAAVGGGRPGAWNQPAPVGNTATPTGPQANDPRVQRRLDTQTAAQRPAGGNIGGMLKDVPKDLSGPTLGQGRLFDDPWQM